MFLAKRMKLGQGWGIKNKDFLDQETLQTLAEEKTVSSCRKPSSSANVCMFCFVLFLNKRWLLLSLLSMHKVLWRLYICKRTISQK